MEGKDIIGKKFTCFEFPYDGMLHYSGQHKEALDLDAVVLNLHALHPKYAKVEILKPNGEIINIHYPVESIIAQLKDKENTSIDEIINHMKQLISRI